MDVHRLILGLRGRTRPLASQASACHTQPMADAALPPEQADMTLFIESARAELKLKGVDTGGMTPRQLFDAVNGERADKLSGPLTCAST